MICISFLFCENNSFGYKFYKSSNFTLYTIIQQLPEFLQFGNVWGSSKWDSSTQSLYLKRQKPLLLKCRLKKKLYLGCRIVGQCRLDSISLRQKYMEISWFNWSYCGIHKIIGGEGTA